MIELKTKKWIISATSKKLLIAVFFISYFFLLWEKIPFISISFYYGLFILPINFLDNPSNFKHLSFSNEGFSIDGMKFSYSEILNSSFRINDVRGHKLKSIHVDLKIKRNEIIYHFSGVIAEKDKSRRQFITDEASRFFASNTEEFLPYKQRLPNNRYMFLVLNMFLALGVAILFFTYISSSTNYSYDDQYNKFAIIPVFSGFIVYKLYEYILKKFDLPVYKLALNARLRRLKIRKAFSTIAGLFAFVVVTIMLFYMNKNFGEQKDFTSHAEIIETRLYQGKGCNYKVFAYHKTLDKVFELDMSCRYHGKYPKGSQLLLDLKQGSLGGYYFHQWK